MSTDRPGAPGPPGGGAPLAAVAILVGGKSSRFGTDKGLHRYRGRAIVNHVMDRVRLLAPRVLLLANSAGQRREYAEVVSAGVEFLLDAYPAGLGRETRAPLIGLATLFAELRAVAAPVLVVSCDMPFVAESVLAYLARAAAGHDAAVPRWANGYIEPLCAAYNPAKVHAAFQEALHARAFKIWDTIQRLPHVRFVAVERELQPLDPVLRTFKNINTPADLGSRTHEWGDAGE